MSGFLPPCIGFFKFGKCNCAGLQSQRHMHDLAKLPCQYKRYKCNLDPCTRGERCMFHHNPEEAEFWKEKLSTQKREFCPLLLKKGKCDRKMFCTYEHRRDALTVFCPDFLENPCPRGKDCPAPHDNTSLMLPWTFKMNVCKDLKMGCKIQDKCFSGHNVKELEYGNERGLTNRHKTCRTFDEKETCVNKFLCPYVHVRWTEECWREKGSGTCDVGFCVYRHRSQEEIFSKLSDNARSKHQAAGLFRLLTTEPKGFRVLRCGLA